MQVRVRPVEDHDVAAMAALRAREWETEGFWEARIRLYLSGEHSPQQALAACAAFVAVDDNGVVGSVSGIVRVGVNATANCNGSMSPSNDAGVVSRACY
jgi:hypothetical protein